MKRGMLPFRHEAVPLKFGKYLNAAALPTVPAVFGHIDVSPHGGWGMLGNDQYGDCVLAGAAHETIVWRMATEQFTPWFLTTTIVHQYLKLTGGHDTGLDPVVIAEWRRTHGLADTIGWKHRIASYALITFSELPLATYLFGAAGVALNLPVSADKQFNEGHVWDDTTSKIGSGHYVSCVGRNSAGHLMFLTWGRLQAATDEWLQKYMVGGLAYLSQDYLLKTGMTPEAITWDQLAKDLAAL